MQPLVTIYIPTYNRLALLTRALDSARAQSYSALEIIVVDDCSADGTVEYLRQISAVDTRVRFFSKENNSGACISRNIAIQAANGNLVTGLDDDDYILEDHVRSLVDMYQAVERTAKHIAIFPRMATLIGGRGSELRKMKQPLKDISFSDLKYKNFVGNQVLASRQLYEDAGLFNERLPAWQDYDLWLRMGRGGTRFIRANSPTYIYETNSGPTKISNGTHHKILTAYCMVADNDYLSLTRKEKLQLKLNYYRYPQVPMPSSVLREYFSAGLIAPPLKTFAKKTALKVLNGLKRGLYR